MRQLLRGGDPALPAAALAPALLLLHHRGRQRRVQEAAQREGVAHSQLAAQVHTIFILTRVIITRASFYRGNKCETILNNEKKEICNG